MLSSWNTLQRETDIAGIHDTQPVAYTALVSGGCLVVVVDTLKVLLAIYGVFLTSR